MKNLTERSASPFSHMLLAVFVFLAVSPAAHSLDPKRAIAQYSRRIWQVENGLPHRTVYKIAQTRDGYLWLATQRGLTRFDGVRFTVFDSDNTPELKADWIHTLLVDDDGGLWIGAYGGGLSLYKEGRFQKFPMDRELPSTSITALAKTGDHTLWIGTNEGLSRYADGKLVTFNERNGLSHRYVRALLVDSTGILWVGTQAGIHLYKDGRFLDIPQFNGLREHAVSSLHEDRSGRIWIGLEGGGLAAFGNGRLQFYSKQEGLPSDTVVQTLTDNSDSLWIATYGGGLGRLQEGKFDAFSVRNGLLSNNITTLFEDAEHNLWVGVENAGLMRLRDGDITPFGAEEGLSDNQVRSILESRDGSIWIGTSGAGLNRIQNGKIQVHGSQYGLGNESILSLAETSDGSIWVGTRSAGLNQIQNGTVRRYTTKDGLSINRIVTLCEDRSGRLWFSTGDGLGLIDKGKITVYRRGDGRGGDQISSIVEGPDGALWIGTFTGGIAKFQDGKFISLAMPEEYRSIGVRGLHFDRAGVLWIVSTRNGLLRFKDSRFFAIAGKDGLGNSSIYKILEDDQDRFWLTTANGILRIGRKNLEDFAAGKTRSLDITTFDTSDGMRDAACSSGSSSAVKARDGRLWFSTNQGAVVIDPRIAGKNREIPPVIMEEVAYDGRQAGSGTEIVMQPGQSNLEIRYTALYFAAPESLQFRYKLEGFDSSWIHAGARRIAYYTNIPPGSYRFQVSAGNNRGKWSADATALEIRIQPHFYQTYWFYGLCGIFVVGVAFLLHDLRIRRLRAVERELSERVQQALADVKILRGLLPICASCKKIRDDRGYWNQMESYISQHSQVEFSHGICPKCAEKLYPGYAELFDAEAAPQSPSEKFSPDSA